ncbi:MAG: tautomerase family protein [Candidatus Wallbacteria bacterium]|nr:tautomerase family protein [Candidatus Wallbacteria bacterium]
MPAITIQSLELTDDQKKVLAEKFTSIFSEVSSVPADKIYMFFDGYPLNSCAKGGRLFSENPPQFGKGKF